ncbi:MAG: archaemetzincin family Zn-dependent metalloprotease [Bacteroidota bacterium]
MNKQRIILVSYGQFDKSILDKLASTVKERFGLETNIEVNYSDLSKFYDPARRQYDGNQLLKHVNAEFASENIKAVGLFRVDLFIPILTYIIGQAVYKGNAGVVSLFRLKNELYGIKKDDKLLFERFRKEIIHELGHIFGLIHCFSPSCIMRSSTYVEDVDQKDSVFCSKCADKLKGINHS